MSSTPEKTASAETSHNLTGKKVVNKVTRRPQTDAELSFTSGVPEEGTYWRGLEPTEVAIYRDNDQIYGRPAGHPPEGIPELLSMPTMRNKLCVRFFSVKEKAFNWAKSRGAGSMVLAVPKAGLSRGTEFDVWPDTDDVYITGLVARANGNLLDPNK